VPYTALNNVLQGKFKAAGQDICRLVINTTVGLGGCIDVASMAGIPKNQEDFGQTLGKWGVKPGPFLMLPLVGPSNLRDAMSIPVDLFSNPFSYTKITAMRTYLPILRVIDTRVQLQDSFDAIEEIALDKYAFTRDAWMQRREAAVNDLDAFEGFDKPSALSIGDEEAIGDVMIQAPVVSAQLIAEPKDDVLMESDALSQTKVEIIEGTVQVETQSVEIVTEQVPS
jgi:phospholipid-binding lipoprotein MlaA